MKAEVNKLDINELVNVPTSLNDLETKMDDLRVGKLKEISIDLKEISDVVDKQLIKNPKHLKKRIRKELIKEAKT